MIEVLELHSTYKRHEILIKRNIVSDWCFAKNINVYIRNSVFSREHIYWGWCVCALEALSTFQGKINQLPPSIDDTHRSQERALPNRLLSHSWPLHGFINWVALLSYLDDFDIAAFERRLLHLFCWRWHGLADLQTWVWGQLFRAERAKQKRRNFLSVGRIIRREERPADACSGWCDLMG